MEPSWNELEDLFEAFSVGENVNISTISPPKTGNVKMSPQKIPIDYVGYIFVPLLLILGLTGNTLTIVVMRSSKVFYAMSVSRILIALAVSDTILISLLPFNKLFVRNFLGTDIRALSDAGCKVFYWSFRTAKMTSSWLVVLISIERFIAIWFPIRAKSINTTRKALIGVALVYLIIGTYNGVWCSFSDHLVNGICYPNSRLDGRAKITGGFLVAGLTIYCFLPATVLCIINTLIVVKIIQSTKKSKHLQSSQHKELGRRKPTAMLLGIAIAFILLVTPIASAHLVSYSKKKNIFESSETWVVFLREVSQLMEQLNYSINFVLYVLLGEMFRSRLFEIFGFKKSARNVTTATTSTSRRTIFSSSSSMKSILRFNEVNKDRGKGKVSQYSSGATSMEITPLNTRHYNGTNNSKLEEHVSECASDKYVYEDEVEQNKSKDELDHTNNSGNKLVKTEFVDSQFQNEIEESTYL